MQSTILGRLLLLFLQLSLVASYLFKDTNYDILMKEFSDNEGNFASISSANKLYNIPIANEARSSCSALIARVTDLSTLSSDSTRPQVLISGEIHGDERVGPPVAVVTTKLLVSSAECLLRKSTKHCSQLDKIGSLSIAQRTWLAMLATRRDTMIIPTANCMGYIHRKRLDGGVDPNRDFAYGRSNNNCFRSGTAQLFRELMSQSIIQVVVTFHGGMAAIAYEWGAVNHKRPNDNSPDDLPHRDLARGMQVIAGGFKNEKPYRVGKMNSIVYSVEGGMEDWFYAAGWDPKNVKQCGTSNLRQHRGTINANYRSSQSQNTIRSGLNGSKKVTKSGATETAGRVAHQRNLHEKTGAENRAVVVLVETADKKTPSDVTLGGSDNILDSNAQENGHVPRNTRLALYAIDLVQPYVCISAVSGNKLTEVNRRILQTNITNPEISKNSNDNSTNSLEESPSLSSPSQQLPDTGITINESSLNSQRTGIDIEWYVGGGTTVDCTFLSWHLPVPNLSDTADWSLYVSSLYQQPVNNMFPCDFASNNYSIKSEDSNKPSRVDTKTAIHEFKGYFPVLASSVLSGFARWGNPVSSPPTKERLNYVKYVGELDKNDDKQIRSKIAYDINDPLSPLVKYRTTVYPELSTSSDSKKKPFPAGKYWLIAWSAVDQAYAKKSQGFPKDIGPQTDLANVRTDPSWKRNVHDRSVIGRRYWPSDPVAVVVRSDGSYYIESEALDCAWWDRPVPLTDQSHNTANVWLAGNSNASAEIQLHKTIFDGSKYMSESDLQLTTQRLYLTTWVLILLLVLTSAVAAHQWYRYRSIHSTLANNKYVNLKGFGIIGQPRSKSTSNNNDKYSVSTNNSILVSKAVDGSLDSANESKA